MTSIRFRLIGPVMRALGRRALARATDPVKERRKFAILARLGFRAPFGITATPDPVFGRGEGPSLWVTGDDPRTGKVILHFHGGGYVVGSPWTHWKTVAHLVRETGMSGFLPSYRLAPENPLPAAQEDAMREHDARCFS